LNHKKKKKIKKKKEKRLGQPSRGAELPASHRIAEGIQVIPKQELISREDYG
jgi:hypothetical protein